MISVGNQKSGEKEALCSRRLMAFDIITVLAYALKSALLPLYEETKSVIGIRSKHNPYVHLDLINTCTDIQKAIIKQHDNASAQPVYFVNQFCLQVGSTERKLI